MKKRKRRGLRLPVIAGYALVKRWMERELLETKWRRPWIHSGERAQRLLESSPLLWRIYRAGIAAGLPSEFQKRREVRTERDRLWRKLEGRARERVAQSERPMTLRNAVCEIVQTLEGEAMYRAYVRAARR